MKQIEINVEQKDRVYDDSILNKDVVVGKFLESFIDSKKSTPGKRGLSDEGVVNLRESTRHILMHCNPHDAVDNSETTHLVVGYVQSGKTMSFTALTAMALDNKYRLIIYLAGTKLNLLNQTTERLKKDLIGNNHFNRKFFKIHKDPSTDSEIEEVVGHLELSNSPIVLIPILKHYSHINSITDLVQNSGVKAALKNETVLIIDDEADQASLNSFGRSNSKKSEDEMSSTYDAILKLRASLPGNTYIQYTATPQANILISLQDLLSPKTHTLLTPGEGYVGGKLFFGLGKNHDLFNGALIKEIPQCQVYHKRYNPLSEMPESLKDALMFHILAVAISVMWFENVPFLSMMVHPSERKICNKKFFNWIEEELKKWRKNFNRPDGHIQKEIMINKFKEIFKYAIEFYDENERPSFDEIFHFIPDILKDRKTYLVNTDIEANTDIEWDNCCMHILVGAEMLNRGFTVENLATTYMPRYSKGAANADTIQQRCRFFGYKMDYIKSCRVFLPEISILNYRDYIDHEEELRTTLKECKNLLDAEQRILLSPRLRPTRVNVLPVSVVNTKLRGMKALQAFEKKEMIEANKKLVENFISKYNDKFDIHYTYNTLDRTHRGMKLSVGEAIEFLNQFRFGNYHDACLKGNTIRYLRYLASEDNKTPLRYVYFIQIAWQGNPRERGFDMNTKRFAPNTRLFTGRSTTGSEVYPGDDKIFGPDSITIQIHHVLLKGVDLEFAKDAYTLAINYPSSLATSYCSTMGEEDIDEEDNDE